MKKLIFLVLSLGFIMTFAVQCSESVPVTSHYVPVVEKQNLNLWVDSSSPFTYCIPKDSVLTSAVYALALRCGDSIELYTYDDTNFNIQQKDDKGVAFYVALVSSNRMAYDTEMDDLWLENKSVGICK